MQLLLYAAFGAVPVRWFSQVDPGDATLDARYRLSDAVLRWGSRIAGVPLPQSEYVPLHDPSPVARWMAAVLRSGGTPHLATYDRELRAAEVEPALPRRLAHAHRRTNGGEPITPSRLDAIRRAGAEAAPRYGSIEAGLIGDGCLAPTSSDDHHLYHDLLACVQPGSDGARPDVPADAVLISSLRPTAPLLLLNVALGDRAAIVCRSCGCPLEGAGWRTHISSIRSYEKLTAGGMTLLDADVVRVLEDVLPARFGGGPTDYQLLEEEGTNGEPRLRLLVHPAIGPVDAAGVAETFLSALGEGTGAARVMTLAWRGADSLRVERARPVATASGKILHLHTPRTAKT